MKQAWYEGRYFTPQLRVWLIAQNQNAYQVEMKKPPV
jgi:hypothetical protein